MSTLQVIEPSKAKVMAEIPRAGAEEVDAAVARAKAAFPGWRAVSRAIGPRSCVASPTPSRTRSRISPGSRLATPASR